LTRDFVVAGVILMGVIGLMILMNAIAQITKRIIGKNNPPLEVLFMKANIEKMSCVSFTPGSVKLFTI
ncbi:unnamed protein product, partial [marine sediment metagenome]